MKILYLGPRINIENPVISGGVGVLFEDLLLQMKHEGVEYAVVNTNKLHFKSKLVAYIYILGHFFGKFWKYDHISLHGTYNDYVFIAPVVVFMSKIFNKKVSLRKFAGNMDNLYANSNLIYKILIRYILTHSDINFFETKYLVHYFYKYNQNTFWFPNVRKSTIFRTKKSYNKKFVFMGHVKDEKGIKLLCQVSNLLSNEYTIDIFGSLVDGYTEEYFKHYKLNYKGVVEPSEVTKILSDYDVLILPSYREGYPGVIIEALSVGLVVIATSLDGIKEMINEKMAILIDTGNVQQLQKAIESFDKIKYVQMSEAALMQFKLFDSEIYTKKFLKRISNV